MPVTSSLASNASPAGQNGIAPLRLEVCVGDIEGARVALGGGCDRIELCSALEIGGLTPSCGVMRSAAGLPVPVIALIRPRAGDFTYSRAEIDVICDDISAARDAGLAGVAIGALDGRGALDRPALGKMRQVAGDMEVVLHRAFDLVEDLPGAVEQAVDLGFDRILTSGGARTAPEGQGMLASLQKQAAGRIRILAGSGIAPGNVVDLISVTGIREIHASCSASDRADGSVADLGFEPAMGRKRTDLETVRALRAAMNASRRTA